MNTIRKIIIIVFSLSVLAEPLQLQSAPARGMSDQQKIALGVLVPAAAIAITATILVAVNRYRAMRGLPNLSQREQQTLQQNVSQELQRGAPVDVNNPDSKLLQGTNLTPEQIKAAYAASGIDHADFQLREMLEQMEQFSDIDKSIKTELRTLAPTIVKETVQGATGWTEKFDGIVSKTGIDRTLAWEYAYQAASKVVRLKAGLEAMNTFQDKFIETINALSPTESPTVENAQKIDFKALPDALVAEDLLATQPADVQAVVTQALQQASVADAVVAVATGERTASEAVVTIPAAEQKALSAAPAIRGGPAVVPPIPGEKPIPARRGGPRAPGAPDVTKEPETKKPAHELSLTEQLEAAAKARAGKPSVVEPPKKGLTPQEQLMESIRAGKGLRKTPEQKQKPVQKRLSPLEEALAKRRAAPTGKTKPEISLEEAQEKLAVAKTRAATQAEAHAKAVTALETQRTRLEALKAAVPEGGISAELQAKISQAQGSLVQAEEAAKVEAQKAAAAQEEVERTQQEEAAIVAEEAEWK